MDDERKHLQHEIEQFTALLAIVTHGSLVDEWLAGLLRENIRLRRRVLHELQQLAQLH